MDIKKNRGEEKKMAVIFIDYGIEGGKLTKDSETLRAFYLLAGRRGM